VLFSSQVIILPHSDSGIDNINVTAKHIPVEEAGLPPPSSPLPDRANLDICVTDVMYDHQLQQTVHRKCFDLVADIEMIDHDKVIGEVCVEVVDGKSFQLTVSQKEKWDFLNATAWTGESLDDAYVYGDNDYLRACWRLTFSFRRMHHSCSVQIVHVYQAVSNCKTTAFRSPRHGARKKRASNGIQRCLWCEPMHNAPMDCKSLQR
jgi:hypothetical protein